MFANPKKNLEQFGISPGMIVADLGSGPGFYSLTAGKMVGGEGRVYSIDIQKNLLEKIKKEADAGHLSNVEVIWGDIEKIGGTRLKESSVDAAIASNILFQLSQKDIFIREASRILKPKGRLLAIDWTDSFGGIGPVASSVVTASACKDLFLKRGFIFEKEISAGSHHYGLIFQKI